MPWSELTTVDQRVEFIADYHRGVASVTELSHRYGISRKTAYKWLNRYAEQGQAGLEDQRRTPHSCPHRTAEPIEQALLEAR